MNEFVARGSQQSNHILSKKGLPGALLCLDESKMIVVAMSDYVDVDAVATSQKSCFRE